MSKSALSTMMIGALLLMTVMASAVGAAAAPVYTIVQGDTLWDISRRQGVELEALMRLNGLNERSILQIGQQIQIPASGGSSSLAGGSRTTTGGGTAYRVQAGDNMWRIARSRGVSLTALTAANPGIDPERLQIGQVIRLPESGSGGSVSNTKAGGSRAAASSPGAAVKTVKLEWPLKGTVTSNYGYRRSGNHHGIDIAADTGATIKTAAPGVVSYAGWLEVYGYTVIVDHADGRQTLYAHASQLLVSRGEQVRRGQFIARVGTTGRTTGPHLHFEVRVGGETVNPAWYLD